MHTSVAYPDEAHLELLIQRWHFEVHTYRYATTHRQISRDIHLEIYTHRHSLEGDIHSQMHTGAAHPETHTNRCIHSMEQTYTQRCTPRDTHLKMYIIDAYPRTHTCRCTHRCISEYIHTENKTADTHLQMHTHRCTYADAYTRMHTHSHSQTMSPVLWHSDLLVSLWCSLWFHGTLSVPYLEVKLAQGTALEQAGVQIWPTYKNFQLLELLPKQST